MRPPTVLPVSRATWQWLRTRGAPDRAGWQHLALYAWQSFWFERHRAIQSRLRRETPAMSDPLFVLGLWRSGTTLMHSTLAEVGDFQYPTTADCMRPSLLRLGMAPVTNHTVYRPMDGVAIMGGGPQEDEFALLALGVRSAYRAFLDPRGLDEAGDALDPGHWRVDEPGGWAETWREFLGDVQHENPGRLVLKSPGHTFRLRAIDQIFPRAHYVWMVRDPREVYGSNLKMWVAMWEQYALWRWDPALLERFLARAFRRAAEMLSWACENLGRQRLVVLRMDELVSAPQAVCVAIARRQDLPWPVPPDGWNQAHPPAYRQQAYPKLEVGAEMLQAFHALEDAQRRAWRTHGLNAESPA